VAYPDLPKEDGSAAPSHSHIYRRCRPDRALVTRGHKLADGSGDASPLSTTRAEARVASDTP